MKTITTLLALALTLPAATLHAQDEAARLAPADAAVFIQINDIARWRADLEADPLIQQLCAGSPMDKLQRNPVWIVLQAAIGMTGPQIIDTYFGKSVAVIGREQGKGKPHVALSLVEPADMDLLRARLELRQIGQAGPFMTYTNADNTMRFGLGPRWLALASAEHVDYFNAVLSRAGAGPTLADNPDFRRWTGRLPADCSALVYVRNAAAEQVHALALVRRGGDYTFHYTGTSPKAREMIGKIGQAGALDFGPLPLDTIAAATINLYDPNPRNTVLVDRLLAPRTLAGDVLPKISAPLLLFLGEVPGAQLDPNPGLNVPAAGLAIRLKDPSVSADLDRLFDAAVLLANVTTIQWKTDPVLLNVVGHNGATFRVATIGVPLAQRMNRPELASLTLAYGRVGQWYVVCTQDQFFRRCVDSNAPGQTLANHPAVSAMGLDGRANGQVATVVLRPEALAAHLKTWLAHWENVRPQVLEAAGAAPVTHEARAVRAVAILAGVMEHYQALNMQVTHDGQAGVGARFEIVRKK